MWTSFSLPLVFLRLLRLADVWKKMTSKTRFWFRINDVGKKCQELFIFYFLSVLNISSSSSTRWNCYNFSLSMPQTRSHLFSRCRCVPLPFVWNESIKNEPFAWIFSSFILFSGRKWDRATIESVKKIDTLKAVFLLIYAVSCGPVWPNTFYCLTHTHIAPERSSGRVHTLFNSFSVS